MIARPDRSEAAPYYFNYIDRVPGDDIRDVLRGQEEEVTAFARVISEERSRRRYAADKWSIRQVLGHINDCERLFVGRAFWFARGFETPLPSFDQDVAMAAARCDERSWNSHVEEFVRVRGATRAFFDDLPAEAWVRRGLASGNPFTVRALAYLTAGHVIHHLDIVRTRYLDA